MERVYLKDKAGKRRGSFLFVKATPIPHPEKKSSFRGLGKKLERTLSNLSLGNRSRKETKTMTMANNPRFNSKRLTGEKNLSRKISNLSDYRNRSSSLILRVLPRKRSLEDIPIEPYLTEDRNIPLPQVSNRALVEEEIQDSFTEPEEELESTDRTDKLVPDLQLVRFNSDISVVPRKKSSLVSASLFLQVKKDEVI